MPGLIDTELNGTKKDEFGTTLQTNATGYDAERRGVGVNETVAGQLDSILKTDSPLLQRARARANEMSNSRGLVNSTMAAQAGETAVIDTAMPIAQADAGTYNLAARENMAAGNDASRFSATAANAVSAQNAESANKASGQVLGAQLETGLIGTRTAAESRLAAERAAQTEAQSRVSAGLETGLIGARGEQERITQAQRATEQESLVRVQGAIQSGLSTQAAAQAEAQSRVDAELRQGLITTQEQADARLAEIKGGIETQINAAKAAEERANIALRGEVERGLQELKGEQATTLANIEAQYKQLMQTSASASAMFNESMQQIATILRDPNTSAEQKASAVAGVQGLLKSGLAVTGSVADVDLSGLLDFGGSDAGAPAATPDIAAQPPANQVYAITQAATPTETAQVFLQASPQAQAEAWATLSWMERNAVWAEADAQTRQNILASESAAAQALNPPSG